MQCAKERFEKSPITLIRYGALLALASGSLAAAANTGVYLTLVYSARNNAGKFGGQHDRADVN